MMEMNLKETRVAINMVPPPRAAERHQSHHILATSQRPPWAEFWCHQAAAPPRNL